MRNQRVVVLAEVALAVALAAALNYVGLRIMPQGGAVSLVMLPILVVAIRRGVIAGILAGALYGVIDFLMAPYLFHWAQVLLDYSIAFAAVGLAGTFSRSWNRAVEQHRTGRAIWTVIVPAVAFGSLARYCVHVLSGVLFFAEYAPEGQPVLIYSLVYNATYMLPSAILCAAAAAVVLPALRNVGAESRSPTPVKA